MALKGQIAQPDADKNAGDACVPLERIAQFSGGHSQAILADELNHLEGCTRCASRMAVFRAGSALSALPSRWAVHLGAALRARGIGAAEATQQILGFISLESREFTSCHEDEWVSSPVAMRVNLVVDARMEVFILSVIDIPVCVEKVSLVSSKGLQPLSTDQGGNEFRLVVCENGDDDSDIFLTFSDVWMHLRAHKLQLVVDMTDVDGDGHDRSHANDIVGVLEQHQAIERFADYILPSGLHSDTYINSSALCSCEESMQLVASKIDFLFWDTYFDTVLASGWAMDLIGRRLSAVRRAQGRVTPIREVMCEGYGELVLLQDIIPGSQVLIIVDVVLTGRLATELQRIVQAAGADVVGVGALVRPHGAAPVAGLKMRALCEVEMSLIDTQKAACPRCVSMARREFNPVARCMTTKCKSPRSASQFLMEDENARELWELVRTTGAYEHHRREGDTHYVGFVDTRKLLGSRTIAANLVQRLAGIVNKSGNNPSVLLVPRRCRAGILAVRMRQVFAASGGTPPRIIKAARKWRTGRWELSSDDYRHLGDADVLIVDTAAGHGRTVDQLAMIASSSNARRIGAAMLLSRLTPPCEDAFNLRLSGGFHRLFNLPIRPVAIRGNRADLCPVCRRKSAIRRFAEDSDIAALEQWAASLLKPRRGETTSLRRQRDRQLPLFPEEFSFLWECGAAVASGITLHALGAASTNGTAPLSLPELSDDRIPWRSRATMVENLPPGVLEWTGETLLADLSGVLANGDYPSIWKSTANLLAREGNDAWLDFLESLLSRLSQRNHRASVSFWNHMACNAYLLASSGNCARDEVKASIDQLLRRHADVTVQQGLRQMLEAIAD